MAKPPRRRAEPLIEAAELRIVGGKFRGRKLKHEPFRTEEDALVTRPMKHRLRETIFNLIGTEVQGRHAIDLFAGTGALGLEALSRGATHATFIERHVPTARVIEENIRTLETGEQATVLTTSAFLWVKRDIPNCGTRIAESESRSSPHPKSTIQNPNSPWLVFCSPPYDFFVERQDEMLSLIATIMQAAPAESIVVVESDERFDPSLLPAGGDGEAWDIRAYPPAIVGVRRKNSS